MNREHDLGERVAKAVPSEARQGADQSADAGREPGGASDDSRQAAPGQNRGKALDEDDELFLAAGLGNTPLPQTVARAAEQNKPVSAAVRELEALVSRNQWQRICEVLGGTGDVSQLSPTLQVLYGIALKELPPSERPLGVDDTVVIKAMAVLLGVPEDSPIAVMVAKRATRSRPTWTTRKAPKGPYAAILIGLAISVGALAGWLSTMM